MYNKPIYTEYYTECGLLDLPYKTYKIKVKNDGGISYLKVAKLHEVMDKVIYIEINHEIEYPYACIDFEEVVSEKQKERLDGRGKKPRRFCEATLVATPKMRLI